MSSNVAFVVIGHAPQPCRPSARPANMLASMLQIAFVFRDAPITDHADASLPASGIFTEVDSFQAYTDYLQSTEPEQKCARDFERQLLSAGDSFDVDGFCRVCNKKRRFHVDYQSAYPVDGVLTPNWRERLVCNGCHLNNRTRAAVHLFLNLCGPARNSTIYVTEQTTRLYHWLDRLFTHVVGSEYLGDTVPLGASVRRGLRRRSLRNEDFTNLTFEDASLDFILSFDVLEHIPSYRKALKESLRCLRPGGVLLFSVPFEADSETNIVRARLNDAGDVEHLMPPEYHGSPIHNEGFLCYYHFGWDLLDDLRSMGFGEVKAHLYWSSEFGYLGRDQILFVAKAPGDSLPHTSDGGLLGVLRRLVQPRRRGHHVLQQRVREQGGGAT